MAIRPQSISLCAGAGGLDLAVELAVPGARTVAYVEREAYAAATLVARMEQGCLAPAPVWSDLGTFDARPWRGRVHLVTSGDPCQPNSVAGKGLGADDDRFLIDQVLRVVDECRPLRLFRENVPGNADGQLAALVPPLERMGFRVAAGIFSVRSIGGAHIRERLVIMADRPDDAGRLHAGQWGSGEAAADARGDGGDLVDAIGNPVRSSRFGPASSTSGGSGCEEREQWLRVAAGERGADLGAGPVADADVPRPSQWPRAKNGRGVVGEEGATARTGRNDLLGDVPDPECRRRSRGEQRLGCSGRAPRGKRSEQANGVAGLRAAFLPILCPGPSDPRWPDIITAAPHLEPAVRRMADGLAHRVDRLRLGGNGVHPLALGYAWVALDALHASAAGAGFVPVRAA